MAKQQEGKLVKKIQQYLEARGAFTFKVHGGDNPFQRVGIPDLLCCWKGQFIALEVKLPGEKASSIQLAILKEIRRAGGTAEIVTSVIEVQALLAKFGG